MNSTVIGRAVRRVTPAPLRRIFSGFWMTPILLGAMGLGAAFGLNAVPEQARWLGDLLGPVDEDGARAALSAVAGAVISVFSIVLSLTFVALSLTAQQLSPRMLDFVLRETIVQVLTGATLATFLFCAASLSFGAGETWRLGLATPVALTLATLTLGVVVAFAHRMTEVMRPDEMVARRGDALRRALAAELKPGDRRSRAAPPPEDPGDRPLLSPFSGYVGLIDEAALVAIAKRRGGVLALAAAPGAFLLADEPLARLIGAGPVPDGAAEDEAVAVARAMGLSNRTETGTGALYEARALAEGGIRALSPGVNDPGTAIACINRLMDAAERLATADQAPNARADAGGALRLVLQPLEMALLADRSLVPLAWHSRGDAEVRAHYRRLAEAVRERTGPRDRPALDLVIKTLDASD